MDFDDVNGNIPSELREKIEQLGIKMELPAEQFFNLFVQTIKDAGLDAPNFETGLLFGDKEYTISIVIRKNSGPRDGYSMGFEPPAPTEILLAEGIAEELKAEETAK